VFCIAVALTGALLAARATHQPPRAGLRCAKFCGSCRDGGCALRGDDHEPHRRSALRSRKPANEAARVATGALTLQFAWFFTLVAVVVFFVAAWQLNPLALKLARWPSPSCFFYSFTKRFTNWSHLFLGFALGISPAAAWIAITGSLDLHMLIPLRGGYAVGRRV